MRWLPPNLRVCILQAVILYGTSYLLLLWIYFGVTGLWVYRALDWGKPFAIVYYIILPVLLLISNALM